MSQNNLKKIKKIRLEKIDFLKRKSIQPYAYKYDVKNSIDEIKCNPEKYLEKATSIAGRIISLRKTTVSTDIMVEASSIFGSVKLIAFAATL